MAETIKGINITIGGDTGPLDKALSSVNSKSRDLQSELKQVEKLLKLDPTNTELLAQKQKLLAEAVTNTKGKLDTLKQAQQQVQEQFAKGEVTEGQYRALQREISQTEQYLKNLEKQASSSNTTLSKITSTVDKIGGVANKIGETSSKVATATAPATLAITGLGALAVNSASNMAESVNKVEVAFGSADGKIKEFAETSLKTYGIAKGSALDMASLFGDMATSMSIPQDEAANMSTKLVGLAGDLSSFKNVSLDVAQNALKGIFTGEGESLKSLGVIMTDTTLKEYALSKGIEKNYSDFTQAEKVQLRYQYVMDMTKNAQGDFARTSDGTANSIRVAQESIKELSASIGEKLLPIITPIIQKVTEIIQGFAKLDSGAQNLILGAVALIAAISPIAGVVAGITTVIGGLSTALTFLLAHPIVLIIAAIVAAIAGLVVGFMYLWNNCEGFRNFFIGMWDAIKNTVSTVVDWFKTTFTQTLPNLFAVLISWIDGVFKTDWTNSFGAFGEILNAFFQNLSNIWERIKAIFQAQIDFIKNVFSGNWSAAWQNIVDIFKNVFGLIIDYAKIPINGIIGLLNSAVYGINQLIGGLNSIKFDIPSWVPMLGGKNFSLNIPQIPHIPLLAKGGVLSEGQAIIAEAGPELVQMVGGKATVTPLSSSSQNTAVGGTMFLSLNLDGNKIGEIVTPFVKNSLSNQLQIDMRSKGLVSL